MPDVTPTKAPDPQATQRALVYAITGLLAVAGFIISIALNDPCADIPDPLLRLSCDPPLADRLPSPAGYGTLAAMVFMVALAYQFRLALRAAGTAVVGVAQAAAGVAIASAGMSPILAIAFVLAGLALVVSAVGIHRGSRVAWAFAASIAGVLGVVYFFGSSRIASGLDTSLAVALLPAVAVFYPLAVMLATAPPTRAD